MTWLNVIIPLLTFILGGWFVWCSNKGLEKLEPIDINVIDGIILPDPKDPRWWNNKGDTSGIMTLGKIEVYPGKIVFDRNGPLYNWINKDNVPVNNPISRYYIAICNNLAARASEHSILHAKMPPKRLKALPPIKKDIKVAGPDIEGFEQPSPGLYPHHHW